MKTPINLRKCIRRSPLLYKFYLKQFRPNLKRRFPDKLVDLHVTGFPRCANTFAMRLLNHSLPELTISTHIHAIASLKMASSNGVPTLVLKREPSQAIASLVLKGELPRDDPDTLTVYLEDYVDYYGYVAEHHEKFTCLDFTTLIAEPYSLIEAISPYLNRVVEKAEFDVHCDNVMEEMKSAETARPDSVSQLPNAEKKSLKAVYLEQTESHALFEKAYKIYKELG